MKSSIPWSDAGAMFSRPGPGWRGGWLALALGAALWSLAASAADNAQTDRLALAREYVANAKPHGFLDHLPPPDPDADADRQRLARAVRAMPREVLAQSLAAALAERASLEQLREAAAYARSDAGRFAADCFSRMPFAGARGEGCFGSDEDQQPLFAQVVAAQSGVPGQVYQLAAQGMQGAIADALRALMASDDDTRRFFDDYCARQPQAGPCPSLRPPSGATPTAESRIHD